MSNFNYTVVVAFVVIILLMPEDFLHKEYGPKGDDLRGGGDLVKGF